MTKVRTGLFAAVAMMFLVTGSIKANAILALTSEYTFSGTCTDCTGFGIGDLVLTGYTPGNNITPSNFVSYHYSSNLISYSVTTANLNSISGDLSTLPGQDAVTILGDTFSTQFISRTNGTWCTGSSCLSDFGPTHTWSVTTSSVPEPASLALLGLGLAGLSAARRKRHVQRG